MEEVRFGSALQNGVREFAYRFAPNLQVAATLTLKTTALIKVPRFENYDGGKYEFLKKLNDEIRNSTIRRFEKRLTQHLYGNQAKHKNNKHWAKPLILVAVEGLNTHKRPHLHIAVGNIPEDKLARIDEIITKAWHDCDFGNDMTCIKPLSDSYGWLDYMTKEVGYTDNDAFSVEHTCIPGIITERICTESRLLLD